MRLSDRHNSAPVPYRDSKLTRLLRHSLEGKSKVMIVCNISPSGNAYDESLSTLKFAQRAKKIKHVIQRNEVLDSSLLLKKYEAEIERLQGRLAEMETLLESRTENVVAKEIDSLELKISTIQTEKGRLDKDFSHLLKEKLALEEQLCRLKSFILSSESVKNEVTAASDLDEMLIDLPQLQSRKSRYNAIYSPPALDLSHAPEEGYRESFLLDKLDQLPQLLNSVDPLESVTPIKLHNECTHDELSTLVTKQAELINSLYEQLDAKTSEIQVLRDELSLYKRNMTTLQSQLKSSHSLSPEGSDFPR